MLNYPIKRCTAVIKGTCTQGAGDSDKRSSAPRKKNFEIKTFQQDEVE